VVVIPLAQYARLAMGENPARSAQEAAIQRAGRLGTAHHVIVATAQPMLVQQQRPIAQVSRTNF